MKNNKSSNFKTDLRERCYNLSLRVIFLVDSLPKKRSAWIISDQVIRSVCSIGANLIEAKGSGSRIEFKRFYQIGLRSANESKYWLELLRDSKLVSDKDIQPLLDELEEVTKMVAAGVLKLKA